MDALCQTLSFTQWAQAPLQTVKSLPFTQSVMVPALQHLDVWLACRTNDRPG